MSENPSNFYNDVLKYANPPAGGCNWDLDYYRTNYINAIMLGQLKAANYIKSGLVPTIGAGVNIDVTAGVAVIGGVEFSIAGFSQAMTLAPLDGVEFNLLYIDYLGTVQVIQTDPPIAGCAIAIVDTDDTAILRMMDATQAQSFLDQALQLDRKNYIIDGDLNFWYESISSSLNGYYTDTMWFNTHTGSSKVHSRESFTLGQTDVPGNPKYFSRTVAASVVGAANNVLKVQRTEDVTELAGETVTASFYAKADSTKNMSVSISQRFGTGGSPSATVTGIGTTKVALSTSWAKYVITADIPDVAGKVLGTDDNSHLDLNFWFDAGSDFDERTDNLGHQSGTFDIARVRLVEGSVDGDDIDETHAETGLRVNRYAWMGGADGSGSGQLYTGQTVTGAIGPSGSFKTTMRDVPVMTIVTAPNYSNCTSNDIQAEADGFIHRLNVTGATTYRASNGVYFADSRL